MEGGGVANPPASVELDGRTLDPAGATRVAREGVSVRLTEDAVRRNAAACDLAERLARAPEPLYGTSTGVGALLDERVPAEDRSRHALRLLRSHAGGVGPLASPEAARAMLVVRANQLGAGGGGVSPGLLAAIVAALNAGLAPAVHEIGAIGTADLTALAEAGLALMGEGDWLGDGEAPPPVQLAAHDGLALLSSNAATIGEAVLAFVDVAALLGSAEAIAALGHLAIGGNTGAYDRRVLGRHAGQAAAGAHLRSLLAGPRREPPRVQDPLSFRCAPQVLGAARDALADLDVVLSRELNTASENPLLVDGVALHHGDFDVTRLALSLAGIRAALLHAATQSVARLSALLDPRRTGLSPFLASGAAGSSGALVLEYAAHSALAELRAAAVAEIPGAVLAFGQEDSAPFAPAATRRLGAAVDAFATVVGAECVAAVRALRLAGSPPMPPLARVAFDRAAQVLPADAADRSLAGDVAVAAELLRQQPLA